MWLIAKNKPGEFNLVISELAKINLTKTYRPITKINKKIKNILLNYFFIEIEENREILKKIKYTKGINQILEDSLYHQKPINDFIQFCKSEEDPKGYLGKKFFLKFLNTKGKFTSGPFKNIFFEVLEQNDKEIKVLLDNYKHTIVINKDQSTVGIDFI
jgi:hypothetical protein